MRTTHRQQIRDGRRNPDRRTATPARAGQALGKTYALAEPDHIKARELAGTGEVYERLCFGWCQSDG